MSASTEAADAIEAKAQALGARAVAEMYRDPFWDQRFGARGRKFADEDGLHHVRYLVEALRDHEPQILERYAGWLQGVLTTRGMCSRHLAENFSRLSRAIAAESIEQAALASEMLAGAVRALRYATGPEAMVEGVLDSIVSSVVDRLGSEAPRTELEEHAALLVSYLADAVHLTKTEVFLDHVRFWRGFRIQQGDPIDRFPRLLEAMSEALPTTIADDIRSILDRARSVAAEA